MAPWWVAPADGLRLALASTASGKVLWIRDDRRVEQHHDAGRRSSTSSARASARSSRAAIGGLVAGDHDLHDARSAAVVLAAVHGHRRVAAAAVDRLRAVLRLRRDPVRVLGAGLGRPRPGRHVHPLRGRARAARLHPGPRGRRRRRRLDRGAPAGVGSRDRDAACSSAPRSASRCVAAVLGALVRPAALGRRARRSAGPVAAALDRRRGARRPADVDRRRRAQVLDRAGGVVTPNDPLDTIERGRARLRHPLAGPRARRRGAGARAGPRGEPRPAGSGRGSSPSRAGRRRALRSTRSAPSPPIARCAVDRGVAATP